MDLRPELYRGILSYGFEKPSAIQKQAIPAFFKNRDIIAQAQSGTGKTATFSISILQNIDVELGELQAAVIGPTRELAEQRAKQGPSAEASRTREGGGSSSRRGRSLVRGVVRYQLQRLDDLVRVVVVEADVLGRLEHVVEERAQARELGVRLAVAGARRDLLRLLDDRLGHRLVLELRVEHEQQARLVDDHVVLALEQRRAPAR